eukprot:Pgem_evm1s16580
MYNENPKNKEKQAYFTSLVYNQSCHITQIREKANWIPKVTFFSLDNYGKYKYLIYLVLNTQGKEHDEDQEPVYIGKVCAWSSSYGGFEKIQ